MPTSAHLRRSQYGDRIWKALRWLFVLLTVESRCSGRSPLSDEVHESNTDYNRKARDPAKLPRLILMVTLKHQCDTLLRRKTLPVSQKEGSSIENLGQLQYGLGKPLGLR